MTSFEHGSSEWGVNCARCGAYHHYDGYVNYITWYKFDDVISNRPRIGYNPNDVMDDDDVMFAIYTTLRGKFGVYLCQILQAISVFDRRRILETDKDRCASEIWISEFRSIIGRIDISRRLHWRHRQPGDTSYVIRMTSHVMCLTSHFMWMTSSEYKNDVCLPYSIKNNTGFEHRSKEWTCQVFVTVTEI